MEMKFEMKIDNVIKYLSDVAKSQLPFATAKALTQTAKDVQAEIIRVLPERFTLRTSWYRSGPYAFKVKPATKANLQAEIYTNAPWMGLQEEGGIKVAHGGKRMIAIPTKGARPDKRKLIPDHMKPAFLLHGQINHTQAKSKRKRLKWSKMSFASSAFIGPLKDDRIGLWQRLPDGKLRLMYQLEPQADITPRLLFKQSAQKVINEKFSQNFGKAFNEAMKSAK